MKNKIIFSSLLLALSGVGFYIFSAYAQSNPADLSDSLKVSVKTPKTTYILGEIVPINIEIRNNGSSDIRLGGKDPQSGYVKVLISNSQLDFKEYANAAWANRKRPGGTLKSGQIVRSEAKILANSKQDYSHLNPNAAKRASEGKIMTDYAFPEAGVYYIKVVSVIPGENIIKIESEPIQITINEPVGEDLEVWNKIKQRSDIGFFMQENQFNPPGEEAKEAFIQEVEQIARRHPTSFLASQIKPSLEKFRQGEEKRKEAKERMKQLQKPE